MKPNVLNGSIRQPARRCHVIDADGHPGALLADDLDCGIATVRARAAQAQQVRRLRNDAERDARVRLAATLHDGVGQTMQALNLGLKQGPPCTSASPSPGRPSCAHRRHSRR